jgi:hypothetical protein
MGIFLSLLLIVVLAWIFIHTVSFGLWTWRNNNKTGAVMVFFIALASAALPAYIIIIREW